MTILVGVLAFIALLILIVFSAGEREWMRQHKGVCDRYIVPDVVVGPRSSISLVSIGARLKFWFDLGQSALGIMTFALLLFANLDKISARLHLNGSLLEGIIFISAAIAFVVSLGFVLDKANFQQHYTRELNTRNEAISDIQRNLNEQHR